MFLEIYLGATPADLLAATYLSAGIGGDLSCRH